MDHLVNIDVSYILKCSQAKNLDLFYVTMLILSLSVCLVTVFWNFWFRARYAMKIHSLIVLFPILKTVHTAIVTINIAICHDQLYWDSINKYLIMGLISFSTITQTIVLTILLVVSKGWGIVRFYVLREEATHVTV